MAWMGIDIGTTGCKAVVFDNTGGELSSAYRDYPVHTPHEGWAELDSSEVLDKCCVVIREAANASGEPVYGIGVSSQGEAVTPVGSDGEVLGGGMVSFDTRAAKVAATWSENFGREKLYQITGHTAHPMFSLYKLLWLRDNKPDVWKKAQAFYCFEDLLHWRLGLEPTISWPMAGRTMLFDVRKHAWSSEILEAVGLDASKLARPLASGSVAGVLSDMVTKDLGLASGAIVVTGGHDQTVGALGVGVTSPGRAMYATGTVECICGAFDSPEFTADLFKYNLCTYDYTVPEMYATVAFSLTGGNILQWFRDEFGRAEMREAEASGRSAYDVLFESMPEEPTDLMVLPHFTPTGTPHFDVDANGAIIGLRLTTKRNHIMRALLEGVAFEMRLNLELLHRSGFEINELVATGGGARSRAWVQLKADVMGRSISRTPVSETGCLGGAILARSASEKADVRSVAQAMTPPTETIEPDCERTEYYRSRFAMYEKLYPALKTLR